jgi:adenylate cyclase
MAQPSAGSAPPSPESAPPPAEQPLAGLASVLLGGPARYTRRQAAERAGISPEQARELWRALGFASIDDDEVAFTDGDVAALANTAAVVASGLVEPAALRTVTRMVGQSMSRLAEWQARLLLELPARRPELRAGEQLADFVARIDPVLEQVQMHVWRRQLADSAQRLLGEPAGGTHSPSVAVGFADLAGYTSLSRQVGVAELAEMLERFEALAADLIAEQHGRVVKTIGDEVLFTVEQPRTAAELAMQLQEQAALAELPPLRIGLAFGSVLARYGDVYGPVVNIASRLTGLARPGTILVDQELAVALHADPAWSTKRLRPTPVRGYSHLSAARLRRAD